MIVLLNVLFRKKSVPLTRHSWHHSKLTDRQGTDWNKQKWCCCQCKNFSRTRDTIRHLKTFIVISSEMPVLLLILCWCYFRCLKIYSEKFFNAYFCEQMHFEIFLANETQPSIFWKRIAWTVKFSLTNLHVSRRSWL